MNDRNLILEFLKLQSTSGAENEGNFKDKNIAPHLQINQELKIFIKYNGCLLNGMLIATYPPLKPGIEPTGN